MCVQGATALADMLLENFTLETLNLKVCETEGEREREREKERDRGRERESERDIYIHTYICIYI